MYNSRGKGRGVREEESNKAPTVEAVFSRIEASEALFRPEIADRGCGGRDVVFQGSLWAPNAISSHEIVISQILAADQLWANLAWLDLAERLRLSDL